MQLLPKQEQQLHCDYRLSNLLASQITGSQLQESSFFGTDLFVVGEWN
jgi:hypothetical protein